MDSFEVRMAFARLETWVEDRQRGLKVAAPDVQDVAVLLELVRSRTGTEMAGFSLIDLAAFAEMAGAPALDLPVTLFAHLQVDGGGLPVWRVGGIGFATECSDQDENLDGIPSGDWVYDAGRYIPADRPPPWDVVSDVTSDPDGPVQHQVWAEPHLSGQG